MIVLSSSTLTNTLTNCSRSIFMTPAVGNKKTGFYSSNIFEPLREEIVTAFSYEIFSKSMSEGREHQ